MPAASEAAAQQSKERPAALAAMTSPPRLTLGPPTPQPFISRQCSGAN